MAVGYETGGSGGGIPSTNWEELWRRRLQDQLRNTGVNNLAPKITPSITQAIANAGSVHPSTGQAYQKLASTAKQGVQNTITSTPPPTGPSQTSPTSTAGSEAAAPSKTGPDQTWKMPNLKVATGKIPLRSWFDDTVMAALGPLARDPSQINYQWTQNKGYGRGVEGLLGQYADPYAMAMVSGQIDPAMNDEYLKYVGGFNEQAMTGYGNAIKFNPRDIVGRVLSASGDLNTDPTVEGAAPDKLGQLLYGGQNAMDPAAQVDTTLKFLESSLTGLMSPVALDSYLNMLADQGRAFLQFKYSEAGAPTPINFGNWILDRLGRTGGL